ncbi:TIGR02569 family protein [Amycolatopsis thermoflava]|uniref:TIGR02569 family protein n=1 Tax=Amycolatopsis thermoflava TaxID=84480 RepID=UPI003656431B
MPDGPRAGQPPATVLMAFGLQHTTPEPLPGGRAHRCGDTVLAPVRDRPKALWLAGTMHALDVPDLRIARPQRARDGRWIVAGWVARRYIDGAPEHRHDEIMLAALKLAHALTGLPRPKHLAARTDPDGIADRVAWGEAEVPVDEAKGGRWFEVLAVARRPVGLPDQVVPGDLFGAVLFDGDAPPGIVDFDPFYRPAEWGAAVAAVDAVAWGDAAPDFLQRWSHLPEWPQLLLRAVLFRLAGNALSLRATAASLDGLRAAAAAVSEIL